MFVSMATIRRGGASLGAARANAGRIASKSGKAIATPAPRRNVRRDRAFFPLANRFTALDRAFGIGSSRRGNPSNLRIIAR
jgi:hypothetical protein